MFRINVKERQFNVKNKIVIISFFEIVITAFSTSLAFLQVHPYTPLCSFSNSVSLFPCFFSCIFIDVYDVYAQLSVNDSYVLCVVYVYICI